MATDLPLTPEDVAEIVAILDGGGYDKLDIATARFRLRVRREGEGWAQEWDYSGGDGSPAIAIDAAAVAVEDDGDGDGLTVRAALPGTFYRAPQPGAPAFVEVGDEVVPDTVVGIIETMKLMNPVHAGVTGKVTAILVGNSEAVDAQTVIMRVEA